MEEQADDGRGLVPERSDVLRGVAAAMAQLTLDTLHEDSRVGLDLLGDVGARTVPTADWVSVTTLRNGTFRTVASNAPVAVELDRLQYEHGTAPCVDAVLNDGEPRVAAAREAGSPEPRRQQHAGAASAPAG